MTFSLVKKYRAYCEDAREEFNSHIQDLMEEDMVRQLDHFRQHFCYTRLRHSMDVAYFSFFISRMLHWDSRSTARAGLLHDLFLYDWREASISSKNHALNHPKVALENARNICSLNKIEEDIIRKHMWLVTLMPPRYKESYIVTFVDKYCAIRELLISLFSRDTVRAAKVSDI